MTVDDIRRYKAIVEAAGQFDPAKIISHIGDVNGDDVTLMIDVNKPFIDGIHINSIDMLVELSEDGVSGDLAVNYTRHENIDEQDAMALFYSYSDYDDDLHEILQASGFSAKAANDVTGSEMGMQDDGRASYDAYEIADEIRSAINSQEGQAALAKRTGFDINDPNLDAKKEDFAKWAVRNIKQNSGVTPFVVRAVAQYLKNSGVKWPQLDVILR